jgi:hypothetical protein
VTVLQESDAKLLDMTFQDNLKWKAHITGKGGLISSLNQRVFIIKKLRNHLNKSALSKVAESLFTSKLRYSLQLLSKVRWSEEDPKNQDLMSLQRIQNKLTRLLNSTKISDKITTKQLLRNINGLSVNQLNAQIKITEIWKAKNMENYPLKILRINTNLSTIQVRSRDNNSINQTYGSDKLTSTFMNDTIKTWN